jgi:acyl-CoA synthetase (AMP-forming)/AMP-acid ligase II
MKLLAERFITASKADPEHIVVIDPAGRHRRDFVAEHAQTLASQLLDAFAEPPTVLVQADNNWQTLAAAVAIGLRGGMMAVISHQATASEFDMALEDINPDAVVASPNTLETWDASAEVYEHRADTLEGLVLAAAARPSAGVERWAGGVAIAMTSGSTGRPKCVVHTEESLRYAAQSTIDIVKLEPGDAIGAFVPLSSMAAFCFGLYLPALLGGTMVCIGRWNPSVALETARAESIKWTMLVPTMALQFVQAVNPAGALASMKAMTVGGGPMDEKALGKAEDLLGTKFLRVFGMSECLGHTSPLPSEDRSVRLGRDGRPFPGTEIIATDEVGNELPAGELGLGYVRGPSLTAGYARDGKTHPPELTEQGFMATGDLVVLNDDGTINVRGRQKDIIIRGGRNIDINEVESAIAKVPGVFQNCVVPVPDEIMGERVAALVVTSEDSLTLEDVTAHLQEQDFPKFKWPESLIVVDELPQNRVGKLSRQSAIKIATDYSSSGAVGA